MLESELIGVQDLPGDVVGRDGDSELNLIDWQDGKTLNEILDEVEKYVLSEALDRCGNQYRVADEIAQNETNIVEIRDLFSKGDCRLAVSGTS